MAEPGKPAEEDEEEKETDTEDGDDDSDKMIEPWVEWIKRATHTAEHAARKVGVSSWVTSQCKAKLRLAGHVARRWDGRWSARCLRWMPPKVRRLGRPRSTWQDYIKENFGNGWMEIAQDRVDWSRRMTDVLNE